MQFATTHPVLLISALALSGVLFFFRARIEDLNERFSRFGGRPSVLLLAWGGGAAFYVIFYLCRPVFYTDYLGGVLGDNYMYASRALADLSYANPQHLYFPYIPAQILRALIRIGIFQPSAPDFAERAFLVLSLPNRLIALAGLWAFHGLLRRRGFSSWECFWAVAFLATSFAYWFWALQSNALGFLLPLLLLTVGATFAALEIGKRWLYVFSALLTALCFYVHIGSAYLIVGLGAGTALVALRRNINGDRQALAGLCFYAATAVLLAAMFWVALRGIYGARSPGDFVAILAGNWSLGAFSIKNLPALALRDGISTNIVVLLGLLQSGVRGNWESAVIAVQLGVFSFILLSSARLVRYLWKDGFLTLMFIAFISCILGFSFRKTWLQYYSVIAPVGAFLFVSAALLRRPDGKSGPHTVLLAVLVLCNFAINGLSSTRVDSGRRVDAHSVYRTLGILKSVAEERSALYIGPSKTYPYNFHWLICYYAQPVSNFKNIRWEEAVDWDRRQVNEAMKDVPMSMDPGASFHRMDWQDPQENRFGRDWDDFELIIADPAIVDEVNARFPGRFRWKKVTTGSLYVPILFMAVNKVPA